MLIIHGYEGNSPKAHDLSLYVLIFHKDGICSPYVLLVIVVADNLHIIKVEGHPDAFVWRGKETQGIQGKLKLWADTDENAPFGLDPILPAELQSQDVLVLIWL